MRKTIISALALLSLTACVQEEMVSVNQGDAIAFDNAFVCHFSGIFLSFQLQRYEKKVKLTNLHSGHKMATVQLITQPT